jgi:hypothetical protein
VRRAQTKEGLTTEYWPVQATSSPRQTKRRGQERRRLKTSCCRDTVLVGAKRVGVKSQRRL